MRKKKIGLLFSGGLDSTYLLLKNLEDGHVVTPIYVTLKNNEAKANIEKKVIQTIFEKLSRKFGNNRINPPMFVMSVELQNGYSRITLPQAPLFITAFAYMQGLEFDEFQVGYVQGDNAISYLNELQELYSMLFKFQHWNHDKPMIPLVFPLTKITKNEFIDEIPDDIAKEIFSCENPRLFLGKDVACGTCAPCKRNLEIISSYQIKKFPLLTTTYQSLSLEKEKEYRRKKEEKSIGIAEGDGYEMDYNLRTIERPDEVEDVPTKSYKQ